MVSTGSAGILHSMHTSLQGLDVGDIERNDPQTFGTSFTDNRYLQPHLRQNLLENFNDSLNFVHGVIVD